MTGNGYNIQDIPNSVTPCAPEIEHRNWYHYYFHSRRGRDGLTANRVALAKLLWRLWSPSELFDEATFRRTSLSFDNPDFVDIVIHSYRHRHRNAPGEERFLDVERALAKRPPITVPSIVLRAGDSGLGAPSEDPSEDEAHFTNLVARRIVSGAGHDLPVQRPDAVSAALLELLSD